MSLAQVPSVASPSLVNRRLHIRQKIDRLAYVHVDHDNGGILLDLSESGISFQGVTGVMEGESCILKFLLPMTARRIETAGQVVWSNDSRKGGGIRFVDLSETMRRHLQDWIAR